jgi:ADP-ribose pyrophosphatase
MSARYCLENSMHEETLSSEIIYDGRIVHLQVRQVRLPDGRETIRELIEHQGAAAIVAVDESEHVLLVKQFRTGTQSILHEIPAGLLEKGENPQDAAIREMREETGYRPLSIESLGAIYLSPAFSTEYVHLFLAKGYEPAPLELDKDEFVEVVRLPFSEALAMIERGEILAATSVTALLKAARLLGL